MNIVCELLLITTSFQIKLKYLLVLNNNSKFYVLVNNGFHRKEFLYQKILFLFNRTKINPLLVSIMFTITLLEILGAISNIICIYIVSRIKKSQLISRPKVLMAKHRTVGHRSHDRHYSPTICHFDYNRKNMI